MEMAPVKGRRVASDETMRTRQVMISDEAWEAAKTQSAAEVRILGSEFSSPGVVIDRAVRLYLGLDIPTDGNGGTVLRRRIRRPVKGGDATEGE